MYSAFDSLQSNNVIEVETISAVVEVCDYLIDFAEGETIFIIKSIKDECKNDEYNHLLEMAFPVSGDEFEILVDYDAELTVQVYDGIGTAEIICNTIQFSE